MKNQRLLNEHRKCFPPCPVLYSVLPAAIVGQFGLSYYPVQKLKQQELDFCQSILFKKKGSREPVQIQGKSQLWKGIAVVRSFCSSTVFLQHIYLLVF